MSQLKDSVLEFFEEQMGMYTNSKGTFFAYQEPGWVLVSATLYIDNSKAYLGLYAESETILEFIDKHKLKSIEDIDQIDSALLWDIYMEGRGETSYSMNGKMVLFERATSEKASAPHILVKNVDHELIEICMEELKTPVDHVTYAIKRLNSSGNPLSAV